MQFYLLGQKISALAAVIKKKKSTSKNVKSIRSKFTTLNLHNFRTRNIFIVGNDFSRGFRKCRIQTCNNPKIVVFDGRGGGFGQ